MRKLNYKSLLASGGIRLVMYSLSIALYFIRMHHLPVKQLQALAALQELQGLQGLPAQ